MCECKEFPDEDKEMRAHILQQQTLYAEPHQAFARSTGGILSSIGTFLGTAKATELEEQAAAVGVEELELIEFDDHSASDVNDSIANSHLAESSDPLCHRLAHVPSLWNSGFDGSAIASFDDSERARRLLVQEMLTVLPLAPGFQRRLSEQAKDSPPVNIKVQDALIERGILTDLGALTLNIYSLLLNCGN